MHQIHSKTGQPEPWVGLFHFYERKCHHEQLPALSLLTSIMHDMYVRRLPASKKLPKRKLVQMLLLASTNRLLFWSMKRIFLEARARRFFDQYTGTNNAGFRDFVTGNAGGEAMILNLSNKGDIQDQLIWRNGARMAQMSAWSSTLPIPRHVSMMKWRGFWLAF